MMHPDGTRSTTKFFCSRREAASKQTEKELASEGQEGELVQTVVLSVLKLCCCVWRIQDFIFFSSFESQSRGPEEESCDTASTTCLMLYPSSTVQPESNSKKNEQKPISSYQVCPLEKVLSTMTGMQPSSPPPHVFLILSLLPSTNISKIVVLTYDTGFVRRARTYIPYTSKQRSRSDAQQ